MTTRIILSVPTGTRHINHGEKHNDWTIGPLWFRRKEMFLQEVSGGIPDIRVRNDTGDVLTRFWLNPPGCSSIHICSFLYWALAGRSYLVQRLKEEGIFVTEDQLTDSIPRNGFRDVYITSTILEKLYESD